MKKCPFCFEEIQDTAVKCRYCGEWLDKKNLTDDPPMKSISDWIPLTAEDHRLKNKQKSRIIFSSRNLFLRIIYGVLWFIPIYFVTNMIVGGIVGAIAGASTRSYEAGAAAGHSASIAFFQKYGLFVLIFQILLTAVLSFLSILPGTGKFKRKKNT